MGISIINDGCAAAAVAGSLTFTDNWDGVETYSHASQLAMTVGATAIVTGPSLVIFTPKQTCAPELSVPIAPGHVYIAGLS